jgi:hypothetical protein
MSYGQPLCTKAIIAAILQKKPIGTLGGDACDYAVIVGVLLIPAAKPLL